MEVGDRVKVIGKQGHHNFDVGDIVKLIKRDDTHFTAQRSCNGEILTQIMRPEDLEPLEPLETRSLYQIMQDAWVEAVGLKVGDYVKVVSKTILFGWQPDWVEDMDDSVGQTYKVTTIRESIRLNRWNYPFTSLEKVEPPVQSISVGDVVAVLEDGTVTIGQTKLTFKDFDNLVRAVNGFRNS